MLLIHQKWYLIDCSFLYHFTTPHPPPSPPPCLWSEKNLLDGSICDFRLYFTALGKWRPLVVRKRSVLNKKSIFANSGSLCWMLWSPDRVTATAEIIYTWWYPNVQYLEEKIQNKITLTAWTVKVEQKQARNDTENSLHWVWRSNKTY